MPKAATYRIDKSTGFYPQLNVLLIALQGLAIVASLRLADKCESHPGDYLTIQAKHLQKEVRLPLVGPVEAALLDRKADEVHVTVVHGQTACNNAWWTSGFVDFVAAIFLPFLVNYHEQYRPEIEGKYPKGRPTWPDSWQMSWALRNAASHSGKVFKTTTRAPISWRGLTFGPSDEPAKSILSLVNGADILILFLEMEEARTGVPLRRASC